MKISTVSFVFEGGEEALMNDESVIKDLLHDIVNAAGLTPLNYTSHKFEPQGVSATLILSESHIAVHTWPELGSGYIILTSCVSQDDDFMTVASETITRALKVRMQSAKELS